jgi:hypothetical protein
MILGLLNIECIYLAFYSQFEMIKIEMFFDSFRKIQIIIEFQKKNSVHCTRVY